MCVLYDLDTNSRFDLSEVGGIPAGELYAGRKFEVTLRFQQIQFNAILEAVLPGSAQLVFRDDSGNDLSVLIGQVERMTAHRLGVYERAE